MTNNFRVLNITRNYWIKRKSALKGIHKDCNLAWVVENESVRDLTLAEQVSARNEQAKLREPLANAELPGLVFRPPVGAERAQGNASMLIWEAHCFAREAVPA